MPVGVSMSEQKQCRHARHAVLGIRAIQATVAPEPHATPACAAAEWDYEAKVAWFSQTTKISMVNAHALLLV